MAYFYISLLFVAIAFLVNNKKIFSSFVQCFGGFAFAITGLVNFGLIVTYFVLMLYTCEAKIDPWLLVLQFVASVCAIIYIFKLFKSDEEDKSDLFDRADDHMRSGNSVRRSKRTMVHGRIRDRRLRDGSRVYHWRAKE